VKKIPEKIYITTIAILLIAFLITLYGWYRASQAKDFYDEYFSNDDYSVAHYTEEQNENVGESEIK
jgi:hypothetical protein